MTLFRTLSRSKTLWKVVLVNAILIVGLVLIFELIVRLFGVTPESFYTRSYRQFGMEGFPRWYFMAHEERGFDIAPNSEPKQFQFEDATVKVFSNHYGCFDHREDVPFEYVLLLGDSFTWGYAPYESKWGLLLEKQIDRRVLKCGVSDTGQKHQLLKGKEIVARIGFAPKVVLVGYYLNDANDDLLFPSATVIDGFLANQTVRVSGRIRRYSKLELQERYRAFQAGALGKKNITLESGFGKFKAKLLESDVTDLIRRHSVAANLLWRTSREIIEKVTNSIGGSGRQTFEMEKHLDAKAQRDNEKAVRSLEEWANSMQSELVIVLIPPKNLDEDRYVAFKKFLDGEDIEYLDLYPHFLKEQDENSGNLYWRYDSHWTPLGNKIAAEAVASYLLSSWNRADR